jgi:hypothetical protein
LGKPLRALLSFTGRSHIAQSPPTLSRRKIFFVNARLNGGSDQTRHHREKFFDVPHVFASRPPFA